MDARALVLAAILATPGLALADPPPPSPAPPSPGAEEDVEEDDETYCAWRCRSRAGCFHDDRCRVYRERSSAPPAGGEAD